MTVSIETARAAYADIDAERSRQLGLQQNGGSELEPLERGSELQTFREVCAQWYKHYSTGPCAPARLQFHTAMRDRFGDEKVRQFQRRMRAVLNATEAKVRAVAPPGHGCPLCASHAAGDETVGRRYETGGRWVHSIVAGRSGYQRPCQCREGARGG